MIADHQGNGTDDYRENGTNVREHILNRECAVTPLVALRVELVHGAAGDHAVHVADAAVEHHADYAEPRDRE